MKTYKLFENLGYELLNKGADRLVSGAYCCDLLSVAMSKGKENAAWVTVMSNVNTVAVCTLVDMSCIVLADGSSVDEAMLEKAKEHNVCVMRSKLPVFETAKEIFDTLNLFGDRLEEYCD